MLTIARVEPHHIAHVATNIREIDRQELAIENCSPIEALCGSCDTAKYLRVLMWEGEPAAIYGASGEAHDSEIGSPWLLATDRQREFRRGFAAISRQEVSNMLHCYRYLQNRVWVKNTKSIRWLKWCGFLFADEPVLVGEAKEPFYNFWMERQKCAKVT